MATINGTDLVTIFVTRGLRIRGYASGATHEIAAEAQPVSGRAFSPGRGVIFRALVMASDCDDSDLLIS